MKQNHISKTSHKRNRDFLFACGLALLCLLAAVFLLFRHLTGFSTAASATAVITVNGQELARLPLADPACYAVKDGALQKLESSASKDSFLSSNPDSDINIIEITDGSIRCTNANCPDQICVRTPALDGSTDGMPIACLPHRLVLSIEQE